MPIVLKSVSLNLLEPSGPAQACTGIALPLPFTYQLLSSTFSLTCFSSLIIFKGCKHTLLAIETLHRDHIAGYNFYTQYCVQCTETWSFSPAKSLSLKQRFYPRYSQYVEGISRTKKKKSVRRLCLCGNTQFQLSSTQYVFKQWHRAQLLYFSRPLTSGCWSLVNFHHYFVFFCITELWQQILQTQNSKYRNVDFMHDTSVTCREKIFAYVHMPTQTFLLPVGSRCINSYLLRKTCPWLLTTCFLQVLRVFRSTGL
jgi:hypothetical protein